MWRLVLSGQVRHFAELPAHSEFVGDHVAQCIARVAPHRIRFINVPQHVSADVRLPVNPLEIRNELLAAGIDPYPALARLVVQHRIHAIDPVLYRWIGRRNPDVNFVRLAVEEISDDLPVRAGCSGLAPVAGRIPVDMHWRKKTAVRISTARSAAQMLRRPPTCWSLAAPAPQEYAPDLHHAGRLPSTSGRC